MPRFRWLVLSIPILLCASFVTAEDSQNQEQELNQKFQSAVAQYNSGQFAESAARLEEILPHAPGSFEVHELLGLVYAAQKQDAKALKQLKIAAQLKPDSAAARTNLAAEYSHAGDTSSAAEEFRKALALEPRDFDANHNLGELYIQSGKLADAIPFLEEAQRIQPASYNNGYDLAMAYFLTGKLGPAQQLVQTLLKQRNTGELHNLLGRIDEKNRKFVEAGNEYGTAAHLDPSEDNLFDWGSELLLHRAYDPAIDVFRQASKMYPKSPRLLIGLGMAQYARGIYDDAVKALLAAADLDPSDARCYFFLSKAYDSSPNQADAVIQRFQRYAALQPDNGLAQYYYAMSLWKGKRVEDAGLDIHQVESLLQKAISLDEKLAPAHLQLGNLYADQREYDKSIPQYERALQLDPNLPDAHYRLGTDYVHLGQKDRAHKEFDIYQQLRAQHLAELDKERAEVQQFIYEAKSAPSARP